MSAILITTTDLGGCYLQGSWPDTLLVAKGLMPHLVCGEPPNRIGDDFRIELDNARAVYRWVACDAQHNRVCERISSHGPA